MQLNAFPRPTHIQSGAEVVLGMADCHRVVGTPAEVAEGSSLLEDLMKVY
jgi:hypothetical protein